MLSSRRSFVKGLSVGIGWWQTTSWLPAVADVATQSGGKPKSVILIWLNGGPSTIDLWDLKPGHENGGPFREIATSVPGIRISEHLPNLAGMADDFSLIRSMATREGDHARARVASITGYTPQGAISFPAIGSLVAHEFEAPNDIPPYVHIGGQPAVSSGGFLGPRFAPFVVGGGVRLPTPDAGAAVLRVENLTAESGPTRDLRLGLLADLSGRSTMGHSPVVESVESARLRALRLMKPEAAAAFALDQEPAKVRESYGATTFGQGCLLARRLVERGVRFVEVTLDGWDTHGNNFEQVKTLSQQLDRGVSSLFRELRERGQLSDTLIVCQGEFGRTPRINGQAGRDHWPATWAVMLGGAGIRGGHVVGKTSPDGGHLESEPTRTGDLMATVFRSIGLDPRKQNMSNVGRPIRLADPDGEPIEELLL